MVAAALKQVDTCEMSPSESIATNLVGTQNVVTAVKNYNTTFQHKPIDCMLFVSTDKACAPVNVYGMCKAISERVVTSQTSSRTRFLCTRYGNVLESRGSIIPLFKYQAEFGEHLTVTDPNMTRYVMTLDESVNLIDDAITNGHCGDTWIPKLLSMRIGDLAEIFSERYNKPVKIVGLRPGEKMHEELINESESIRCRSTTHDRYVICSATSPVLHESFKYTSADNVMSKVQLVEHLNKLGIINAPLSSFQGLHIEEIAT
jgi:UDP-glucose 4-epimerase